MTIYIIGDKYGRIWITRNPSLGEVEMSEDEPAVLIGEGAWGNLAVTRWTLRGRVDRMVLLPREVTAVLQEKGLW